jgi:hypothetical protein
MKRGKCGQRMTKGDEENRDEEVYRRDQEELRGNINRGKDEREAE